MTPKGKPLQGVYTYSYWFADMPSRRGATVTELVEKSLRRVARNRTFLKEVVESGGRWEFYVTGHGSSIAEEFNWELFAELGEMRCDLSLEVIRELPK